MPIPDVTQTPVTELLSLAGRCAVITGGACGLGKATARRLLEAGASVLIADINADQAAATALELAQTGGGRILSTYLDVTDGASVASAADLAVSELGGLDIWVNNAGITIEEPLLEATADAWDRTMAVNLRGVFLGAREAARRMTPRGSGVIINLASLAGYQGTAPNLASYVASKHGVRGMTRQLALELAEHGIRVLGVAPGFTVVEYTEHLLHVDPELLKQSPIPGIAGSRLGRVGRADDIARVILFCASDMAMFMTGTTLLVDGGTGA